MNDAPLDAIQDQLRRFHESGDQRALAQAFTALRTEFVGPVARFLREAPTAHIVEQVLSELLIELLSVRAGAPPRVLAPAHHDNPAAFRRRVLLNALRDRARRNKTYQRALAAHAINVPPASIATLEQVVELRHMRAKVVALLPNLEIRRRVAIALELGIVLPLAWLEELANELGQSLRDLLSRLRSHEAAPYDEETKLRVLYGPPHRLEQARDAFRQTVSRASLDLQKWIQRGRS
ncbi:MAG TPA: hypothetical protein PLW65_04035 [Pseudomonadota bacterium]|nr:hypothetical protein [Pseudomonadota bacterium]